MLDFGRRDGGDAFRPRAASDRERDFARVDRDGSRQGRV